ncbi:hypothetical protein BDV06DRAFT_68816 [Aspergillus oleicola]
MWIRWLLGDCDLDEVWLISTWRIMCTQSFVFIIHIIVCLEMSAGPLMCLRILGLMMPFVSLAICLALICLSRHSSTGLVISLASAS